MPRLGLAARTAAAGTGPAGRARPCSSAVTGRQRVREQPSAISDQGVIMAKAALGNHSAIRVPFAEKDRVRRFYRDVLGCEITRAGERKDDFRLGDDFYIAVLYED